MELSCHQFTLVLALFWFSLAADFELFDNYGRLLTKGPANVKLDVSMLVTGKYYVWID